MGNRSYVKQWDVPGSRGKTWRVSIDDKGNYSCSCPRWIFKREECKHIQDVIGGGYPEKGCNKPTYVLADVSKPIFKPSTNEIFIPLVRFDSDSTHMQATICAALLKHGYSIHEINELRNLPASWTAQAITSYIERYGEADYASKTSAKGMTKSA